MASTIGKESKTSHWFNTAALALAVDLFFVFPISHTSLIGQSITSWASSIIVPPLDVIAIDVFGMQPPSEGVMDLAAQYQDAANDSIMEASNDEVYNSMPMKKAAGSDLPVIDDPMMF